MQTCYRHPNRETAVSCSSCGRPICPDCMTPTPVGMRCPECSRQRTKVTRGSAAFGHAGRAPATLALIAINVVAFLIELGTGAGGLNGAGGSTIVNFGLQGAAVADGEWYRLLTGAFLHAGILHIAFNMYVLYVIGELLEPSIGTPRFLALYFASLFAGSLGALLLSDPGAITVGASGAVFGIFGAAFLIARSRGFGEVAGQLGFFLLLNLALSFGISDISIGGHLGGLVGGLICAGAILAGDRGLLGPRRVTLELAAMAIVGVVSIVAALAVA